MSHIRFFSHFDHHYTPQALAMAQSLFQHCSEEIELICYALDAQVEFPVMSWAERQNLAGHVRVDPIWLVESQESRLDEAQKNRSWKAYCWSLEPAVVHRQLLDAEDGAILCYTDADMWWTADPVPTIRSVMEYADVALSSHRFPAGQEHKERSVGKYNFGCAVIRACDLTRKVVSEWLDQTLAKCDEFGGGDQIHLDSWPDKIGNRLADLPATWNAAPWQHVEVTGIPPMLGRERLISWHFHEHRRGIGKNPVTIQ